VGGMIMGGEKRQREKARLRKGVHVLVCTPGRLLDHLEHTECLVLDRLSFFVLDEADRLMDMGFERDLAKIVALLDEKASAKPAAAATAPAIVDPRTGLAIQSARTKAALASAGQKARRQNILVSATLNAEIEKMASITLRDPVLIGFKSAQEEESLIKDEEGNALVKSNAAQRDVHDTSLPVGLVQQYLQVEHRHKIVALGALLRKKVVEAEIKYVGEIRETRSGDSGSASASRCHAPFNCTVFDFLFLFFLTHPSFLLSFCLSHSVASSQWYPLQGGRFLLDVRVG